MMAVIQNVKRHCSIESLISRRCPVSDGARNPLMLAKVLAMAKTIPECLGEKSSMLDLLPGTVIPLSPMEMVNIMTAPIASQPMYPATTTAIPGATSPTVVLIFLKVMVFIHFFRLTMSVIHPVT